MRNYVTFKFRKFYDLDREGFEVDKAMYGYCIFDDYNECIDISYSAEAFKELLKYSNQQIVTDVLSLYAKEFKEYILGNIFKINDEWVDVDSDGMVLEEESDDEKN